MKLAYFIMIHNKLEQFQRLFRAIYDEDNYYLVHVDCKAPRILHHGARAFLAQYPNAYALEPYNCLLGGYSLVAVELQAIERMLGIAPDWGFFLNFSGSDFPLETQAKIRAHLGTQPDCNFIHIINPVTDWPRALLRTKYRAYELKTAFYSRMVIVPIPRNYLPDVRPFAGSAWHTLSREFCQFLVHRPEVERFKRFYKQTYVPEEGFFQTVIMNSRFAHTVVNDNQRLIVWPDRRVPWPRYLLGALLGRLPHSPKIFVLEDRDFLLSSGMLFARKFDPQVDSRILDALEEHLRNS